MIPPATIELIGTAIFAVAVLHTFCTKWFVRRAHRDPRHAGLWHLLGEVEVVFGFWAFILLACMAGLSGRNAAVGYLERLNFTEPLFVFVILVMAGTKPVLHAARRLTEQAARFVPLPEPLAYYFLTLGLVPLIGSFITEPAAMTLAALMLRDRFFNQVMPPGMKYVTLAVLLVNVSIGGTLTSYAAPPVLMVAERWGWHGGFMFAQFGWKAAIAVFVNAVLASWLYRKQLLRMASPGAAAAAASVPFAVIAIHLLFVAGAVAFAHHPAVFMGLFLFFLGYAEAYRRHQDALMLREGLLVAFFLAGLIVLGQLQKWWLQPLLGGMDSTVLFFGATLLTAVTDNAALTYLGSLVEGISDTAKYALVAGAVTGGGLTVIANAPNPAGFAILKGSFDEGSISPLRLFLSALLPTALAAACFLML